LCRKEGQAVSERAQSACELVISGEGVSGGREGERRREKHLW